MPFSTEYMEAKLRREFPDVVDVDVDVFHTGGGGQKFVGQLVVAGFQQLAPAARRERLSKALAEELRRIAWLEIELLAPTEKSRENFGRMFIWRNGSVYQ